MSEEFTRLQHLIKDNKAELRLKKSWLRKDVFGVWLYWYCKTKPSVLCLFGKSFILYWIFSSEWLWIPLSIVLSIIRNNWFFLLCILIPFIVERVLAPVGQSFTISNAQSNEDYLDDLWQNQAIGIVSVKKHASPIHQNGTPDIIIDSYGQDWKKEISKVEF